MAQLWRLASVGEGGDPEAEEWPGAARVAEEALLQQYLVLLENQRLARLQCKPLCQWSMKCQTLEADGSPGWCCF